MSGTKGTLDLMEVDKQPSDYNSMLEEVSSNGSIRMESDADLEILLELYGGYFDFFFALFNNILYKSSNYPEEAYFFANMLDMQVPVCEHVKVAEYIELSCKKLVALLCTNSLDGFQLNLTDRTIVLQRFIFEVDGSFNFKATTKLGVKNELDSLGRYGRYLIGRLSQSEDIKALQMKIGRKCARFQIVLGLNEETHEATKHKVHGVFTGDADLDFFPWAKPRIKPTTVARIPMPRCSPFKLPSLPVAKENSPSSNPQSSSAASSPPLRNSKLPTIEPLHPDVNHAASPSGSRINTNIHVFPIATCLFGESLRLNFYSVAYTKLFNSRLTPSSGFSPSNIDSPGLYRATGRVNSVLTQDRPNSPLPKTGNTGSPRLPTQVCRVGIRSPGTPRTQSLTDFLTERMQHKRSPASQGKSSPLSSLRAGVALDAGRPKSARSLDAAFQKSKIPGSSGRSSLSGASGRINQLLS